MHGAVSCGTLICSCCVHALNGSFRGVSQKDCSIEQSHMSTVTPTLNRRPDGSFTLDTVQSILTYIDHLTAELRLEDGGITNDAVKHRLLETDAIVQEFNASHKAVLDLWLHDGEEAAVMRTNLLDMISTQAKLESGRLSDHEKDMAVAWCNHRVIESCKEEETPDQRRQRMKDAIRSKQKDRGRKSK